MFVICYNVVSLIAGFMSDDFYFFFSFVISVEICVTNIIIVCSHCKYVCNESLCIRNTETDVREWVHWCIRKTGKMQVMGRNLWHYGGNAEQVVLDINMRNVMYTHGTPSEIFSWRTMRNIVYTHETDWSRVCSCLLMQRQWYICFAMSESDGPKFLGIWCVPVESLLQCCNASHTCSTEFWSGEYEGQSIHFMPSSLNILSTSWALCGHMLSRGIYYKVCI